ncbi:putative apolipophorins-like 8 [Homarus americanus]|uniref:Putative apolipophorins-like 8 n=1 Tax=Homarus americanus TaxID=6706 RepID=A0A8J5JMJ2_HOMAM|nr:putative apolipophorins-like 8 [Homarus americanus]
MLLTTGIDSSNAYTLKDAKSRGRRGRLKGDPAIWRHINIPKDKLGYCAPLALENNGTIFTFNPFKIPRRRSLTKEKKKVEKLAIVFGRRVVQTALPQERKRCVCVPSTPDGAASVQCDNWNSGHLSILEQYGDEEFTFPEETNSREAGSCIRRSSLGNCIEWLQS